MWNEIFTVAKKNYRRGRADRGSDLGSLLFETRFILWIFTKITYYEKC